MALQSSGPISLNNVNVELGLAGTTSINMNQTTLRVLFKKTTSGSAISMSDGYGKSRMPSTIAVLVVAGGGGSGAGGGGGGGVLPWITITPTDGVDYAITIGAASTTGNGGDSQFTANYIAKGGGHGGPGYCNGPYGTYGQGAAAGTGGSGGGSGNPCRNSSGSPGNGYTNTTPGQGTYNIVQGNRGGYGRDYGNAPYLAGGGGGYAERGSDGSAYPNGHVGGGEGYALDAEIKTVAPFSSTVPGWNTVTTHVGSGGGSYTVGGTGGGGGGGSNEGRMYGAGSRSGSASKAGVVVVKYSGTQTGTGGNNITYVSASDTTYHVFTAAGNFRFDI
jgi:hypothetical protein